MSRARWALTIVCAATFMLVLDVTVVNVALPDMQSSLRASVTQLEWVVDAYAVSLAALLLVTGSLADRYGRRRLFLAGLTVFTLGSLACSLAVNPLTLVAARAVQGVGGATLFATALAILGQEFQGAERSRGLGIWGAALAAGLATGPLAGGILTQLLSWRAIFFVNVPIGVAVFAAALLRLPESADPEGTPLDWPGGATFAAALALFVFALVEGNTTGWSSPVIVGALVASVVLAGAFVVLQRRRPGLFDLSLFSRPNFVAANLAVLAQGLVIGPLLFYLVRYLQEVLGASPLAAGLEVLPLTATCFVAALIGGRLTSRERDNLLLCASLVLLGGGTLLLLVIRPSASWLVILPGLLVAGVGWGAVNPVAAHGVLSEVPDRRSGMASGINNTSRQVGIAIGLGGLGAVFQHRLAAAASTGLRAARVPDAATVARVAARSGLRPAVRAAGHPPVPSVPVGAIEAVLKAATTSGLHGVLAGAGGVAVLAGLGLLALRPGPPPRPRPGAAPRRGVSVGG